MVNGVYGFPMSPWTYSDRGVVVKIRCVFCTIAAIDGAAKLLDEA
jgi:hypothetical protein